MNLTDDERRRFAVYCRAEATSMRGIAEQMQKVNVPDAVAARYRAQAAAHEIVARLLERTEIDEVEQ